jgi:hypothetical protein
MEYNVGVLARVPLTKAVDGTITENTRFEPAISRLLLPWSRAQAPGGERIDALRRDLKGPTWRRRRCASACRILRCPS